MSMLRTPHPQGKRFSQKRYNLNLQSWIEQINEEHKGHYLTYKVLNGEATGAIEGASNYQLDDAFQTVVIRIFRKGKFPEKVFIDQIIRCSCMAKEERFEDVVADYFKQMNRNNGWSMAYTMTQEFFGLEEDELTMILGELGIEDES